MTARASEPDIAAPSFGDVLRRYRSARRMSQLDLALACDVSARHLSFLESGRARPSRDMVLALCEGLRLPRATRNALLTAAGFAPVFPASALASAALAPFRAILDEMIARHAPYPALLMDRYWTVLEANGPARRLLAALQGASRETNIVRLIAESDASSQMIVNLDEVLQELLSRLRSESLEAGDDGEFRSLIDMAERARTKHGFAEVSRPRQPLVPFAMRTPAGELRFLTAIAHFGTSEDVTVRDLRLELLFPADDRTRATLQATT